MTTTTIGEAAFPEMFEIEEERREIRKPGIRAELAGFLAFVSVLLGVVSFGLWWGVGIPVPLLALLGAVIGFFSVRGTLKRPELASERRFARVGMWLGLMNLVLVGLAVIFAPRQTTFASFG